MDAVGSINQGKAEARDFDKILPTAGGTIQTTAILETGRLSLDNGGLPIEVQYSSQELFKPSKK